MKKQNYLMAAAGLVLCSAAHAAPAPSNVGAYYVDRDFDSLDMDGFGVSGLLQVPGGPDCSLGIQLDVALRGWGITDCP